MFASIVNFQGTVILDHTAYFESQGVNVHDNEIVVDSSIETFADDGEKILEANFATKESYDLYNFTVDKTENTFDTYETITRTSKIAGFARNPIFGVHTSLMRFIPVVLAEMHPKLYEQAKDHLFDMNYADYFYLTSYPTYDGYRIEHDPTITAYLHLTTGEPDQEIPMNQGMASLLILGLIIAVIVIVFLIILRRKR
jgi:hypothetical protein